MNAAEAVPGGGDEGEYIRQRQIIRVDVVTCRSEIRAAYHADRHIGHIVDGAPAIRPARRIRGCAQRSQGILTLERSRGHTDIEAQQLRKPVVVARGIRQEHIPKVEEWLGICAKDCFQRRDQSRIPVILEESSFSFGVRRVPAIFILRADDDFVHEWIGKTLYLNPISFGCAFLLHLGIRRNAILDLTFVRSALCL